MIESGVALILIGFFTSVGSFFIQTTHNDYYNTGMLQNQQNILLVGLSLFLSGIILLCSGYLKMAIEKGIVKKSEEAKQSIEVKKATKFGSYIVCPNCQKANPSDYNKCRYCNTELIMDDFKNNLK